MTAETSNARGEWVLVPREIVGFLMGENELEGRWFGDDPPYGPDGRPRPYWWRNNLHEASKATPQPPAEAKPVANGVVQRHVVTKFSDGSTRVEDVLTAPPPAAAEPKTLPVPARVYLTDKAAVIVGDPQRGWDEEGPEAHNCDDMGCSTIGPHVLARVPFTDERALSQPAEARDGGEVEDGPIDASDNAEYIEHCADRLERCGLRVTAGALRVIAHEHRTLAQQPAPPSAPVGVEAIAAEIRASLGGGATVCTRRRWAIELEALAQQPEARVGEAGAFDANFLQSVASLCRAAYDLCQPKPQRTPEDAREHYGELCLLELTSIADEIERRLAAADATQPGGSDNDR